MPPSQSSFALPLMLSTVVATTQPAAPGTFQTRAYYTHMEAPNRISSSIEWPYMASPQEELNNILNTLLSSGLLLDAYFQEISDRYWEIHATMSEQMFYKRNMRMAVIEQITNAIDKRYKIYTAIHLMPKQ